MLGVVQVMVGRNRFLPGRRIFAAFPPGLQCRRLGGGSGPLARHLAPCATAGLDDGRAGDRTESGQRGGTCSQGRVVRRSPRRPSRIGSAMLRTRTRPVALRPAGPCSGLSRSKPSAKRRRAGHKTGGWNGKWARGVLPRVGRESSARRAATGPSRLGAQDVGSEHLGASVAVVESRAHAMSDEDRSPHRVRRNDSLAEEVRLEGLRLLCGSRGNGHDRPTPNLRPGADAPVHPRRAARCPLTVVRPRPGAARSHRARARGSPCSRSTPKAGEQTVAARLRPSLAGPSHQMTPLGMQW